MKRGREIPGPLPILGRGSTIPAPPRFPYPLLSVGLPAGSLRMFGGVSLGRVARRVGAGALLRRLDVLVVGRLGGRRGLRGRLALHHLLHRRRRGARLLVL